MKTLLLHNSDEQADLAEWLRSHEGEGGYPRGGDLTAKWLAAVTVGDYPARIPVPAEHLEPLQFIIADWSEVLESHGESLETRLE